MFSESGSFEDDRNKILKYMKGQTKCRETHNRYDHDNTIYPGMPLLEAFLETKHVALSDFKMSETQRVLAEKKRKTFFDGIELQQQEREMFDREHDVKFDRQAREQHQRDMAAEKEMMRVAEAAEEKRLAEAAKAAEEKRLAEAAKAAEEKRLAEAAKDKKEKCLAWAVEAREPCCICLRACDKACDIKSTNCEHVFHKVCLNNWLNKSHNCPMCRRTVAF